MNKESNKCQEALDLLFSQMEESDFGDRNLNHLIQKYPNCEQPLRDNFDLWLDLATIQQPEPRPEMSAKFYKELEKYSQQKKQSSKHFWSNLFGRNQELGTSFNWAFSLCLLLLGFLGGQLFQANPQQAQIDLLAQEISVLKENKNINATRSLSATSRMKNIQLVRQMDNPNAKILQALNTALCNDSNINVRLSAIESLVHFADDPAVMEILIRAIPKQSSSLVQLELAEVMIQLEEKRSADAWKELLESGDVELDVKMQLEESLKILL